MKLQMKRAALEKINRRANEMSRNPACDAGTDMIKGEGTLAQEGILAQHMAEWRVFESDGLGGAS
jgi:hypothetical protein